MKKLRTFEKPERGLIRKKLDQIQDLKIEDDYYPDIPWSDDMIVEQNIEEIKNLENVLYFFIGHSITGDLGICAEDNQGRLLTLSYNHYTKPDIHKFILKHLGQDLFNQISNHFINVNGGDYLINSQNIEGFGFADYDKDDVINYSLVYFKNDETISLPIYNERFKQEKASIEKQLERIQKINKTL